MTNTLISSRVTCHSSLIVLLHRTVGPPVARWGSFVLQAGNVRLKASADGSMFRLREHVLLVMNRTPCAQRTNQSVGLHVVAVRTSCSRMR